MSAGSATLFFVNSTTRRIDYYKCLDIDARGWSIEDDMASFRLLRAVNSSAPTDAALTYDEIMYIKECPKSRVYFVRLVDSAVDVLNRLFSRAWGDDLSCMTWRFSAKSAHTKRILEELFGTPIVQSAASTCDKILVDWHNKKTFWAITLWRRSHASRLPDYLSRAIDSVTTWEFSRDDHSLRYYVRASRKLLT